MEYGRHIDGDLFKGSRVAITTALLGQEVINANAVALAESLDKEDTGDTILFYTLVDRDINGGKLVARRHQAGRMKSEHGSGREVVVVQGTHPSRYPFASFQGYEPSLTAATWRTSAKIKHGMTGGTLKGYAELFMTAGLGSHALVETRGEGHTPGTHGKDPVFDKDDEDDEEDILVQ